MEYQNFDLIAWPADRAARRYFVSGSGSDGASGQAEVDLGSRWAELEAHAAAIAQGVFRASRYDEQRSLVPRRSPAPPGQLHARARAFGRSLFEAVFAGEVENAHRSATRSASEISQGLRVRLRLQSTPELAALPWEYLHDGRDFLTTDRASPIVRCIDRSQPLETLRIDGPLRALVVTASPSDLPRLDADGELARIRRALAGPIAAEQIALKVVENGRWSALVDALRPGPYRPAYHVLHFIGHGGFNEGRASLAFCGEDGQAVSQSADGLATLLKNHPSLALIVLNACRGAAASAADAQSSMAAALLDRAVPAVVGMQFEISDHAAVVFSEAFYRALADSNPIDAALGLARARIASAVTEGGLPSLEWATPVLYLRATSGQIFDRPPPEA